MRASIIITSFNRPRLLSFGLESLAAQDLAKEDIEVIVLNDGDPNDNTKGVCELFDDELNIRYFASSNSHQRWRVPGFAINYGVRQSHGECLFISCAEIYHIGNTVKPMLDVLASEPKRLVIPANGRDDDGRFLSKIEKGMVPSEADYNSMELLHNIHLPFFLGVRKAEFVRIGGYDEDFTGVGFDDNDIVHRLKKVGNRHCRVDCKIVHLYHPRLSLGDPVVMKGYNYNNKLFNERLKDPVRNCGKSWGESF